MSEAFSLRGRNEAIGEKIRTVETEGQLAEYYNLSHLSHLSHLSYLSQLSHAIQPDGIGMRDDEERIRELRRQN